MNILVVLGIVLVLCWNTIYTVSYAIWTIKENKKGGIALLCLAFISISAPLYLLWVRQ